MQPTIYSVSILFDFSYINLSISYLSALENNASLISEKSLKLLGDNYTLSTLTL
jgi:hypothetical protein